MPKVDEKNIAIARVYSRAMLDVAQAKNQADEVLEELGALADYLESSPDFATFVRSPLVDADQRAESLDKMLRGRLTDTLVDSLQVINRHGRLDLLATIAETYRRELRDRCDHVDVHVRTAVAIDEATRDRIADVVRKSFGKEPDLYEEIDPSLIGGIVLQVEDDKADASVLHKLHLFRQTLAQRAAEEIHRAREAIEE